MLTHTHSDFETPCASFREHLWSKIVISNAQQWYCKSNYITMTSHLGHFLNCDCRLASTEEFNVIAGQSAHTDTENICLFIHIKCNQLRHMKIKHICMCIHITLYFIADKKINTKNKSHSEISVLSCFPNTRWSRSVLPVPLDGWTLPGLSQRLQGKNGYTWSSWCAWCVIRVAETSSTWYLKLGRNGTMKPPSEEMKTLTVMMMMKRKGEIGGNGGALLSPGWHTKRGNGSSTTGNRSIFPGCMDLLLSSHSKRVHSVTAFSFSTQNLLAHIPRLTRLDFRKIRLHQHCSPALQKIADWGNFPEIWVWRAGNVIQPLLSLLSIPSLLLLLHRRFKWASAIQWRMTHYPLPLPFLVSFIHCKPIDSGKWEGHLFYVVTLLTDAAMLTNHAEIGAMCTNRNTKKTMTYAPSKQAIKLHSDAFTLRPKSFLLWNLCDK